jgi:hypothetical protein
MLYGRHLSPSYPSKVMWFLKLQLDKNLIMKQSQISMIILKITGVFGIDYILRRFFFFLIVVVRSDDVI